MTPRRPRTPRTQRRPRTSRRPHGTPATHATPAAGTTARGARHGAAVSVHRPPIGCVLLHRPAHPQAAHPQAAGEPPCIECAQCRLSRRRSASQNSTKEGSRETTWSLVSRAWTSLQLQNSVPWFTVPWTTGGQHPFGRGHHYLSLPAERYTTLTIVAKGNTETLKQEPIVSNHFHPHG